MAKKTGGLRDGVIEVAILMTSARFDPDQKVREESGRAAVDICVDKGLGDWLRYTRRAEGIPPSVKKAAGRELRNLQKH